MKPVDGRVIHWATVEGRKQPGLRERGDRLVELGRALREVGRAIPGHGVVVALDCRAHPSREVVDVAVAGSSLPRDAVEAVGVTRQILGHGPIQGEV